MRRLAVSTVRLRATPAALGAVGATLVLVPVLLLAASAPPALAQAPASLALGFLGSLDTQVSYSGVTARDAFLLALDDINADSVLLPSTTLRGLVNDTQGSESPTIFATLWQSSQGCGTLGADAELGGNVVAIVGAMSSSTSVQAQLVAKKTLVPMISPASTSPILSDKEAYPSFARTVPPDTHQADYLARLVAQRFGWGRVAVVHSTDDYGRELAGTFIAKSQQLHVTVVTIQSFVRNSPDPASIVKSLQDHSAHIILLACSSADAKRILRAAKAAGIAGTSDYVWLAPDSWSTMTAVDNGMYDAVLGAAMDGVVGTMPAVDRSSALYTAINDAFLAGPYSGDHLGGTVVTPWAAYTYDAVLGAARAVHRVVQEGSDPMVNRTGVMAALVSDAYDGATGRVRFTAEGDRIGVYDLINRVKTSGNAVDIRVVTTVGLDDEGELEVDNEDFASSIVWAGRIARLPNDDDGDSDLVDDDIALIFGVIVIALCAVAVASMWCRQRALRLEVRSLRRIKSMVHNTAQLDLSTPLEAAIVQVRALHSTLSKRRTTWGRACWCCNKCCGRAGVCDRALVPAHDVMAALDATLILLSKKNVYFTEVEEQLKQATGMDSEVKNWVSHAYTATPKIKYTKSAKFMRPVMRLNRAVSAFPSSKRGVSARLGPTQDASGGADGSDKPPLHRGGSGKRVGGHTLSPHGTEHDSAIFDVSLPAGSVGGLVIPELMKVHTWDFNVFTADEQAQKHGGVALTAVAEELFRKHDLLLTLAGLRDSAGGGYESEGDGAREHPSSLRRLRSRTGIEAPSPTATDSAGDSGSRPRSVDGAATGAGSGGVAAEAIAATSDGDAAHYTALGLEARLARLRAFLDAISGGYLDNPYHNRLHGTDVMQSCSVMLRDSWLDKILSPGHKLALLLAAAVHDYKHPGRSNKFLTVTRHEYSLTWNDNSVLENMHVSEAFRLMRKEGFDIFKFLDDAAQFAVRQLMIELVLSTDLAHSFKHVSALNTVLSNDPKVKDPASLSPVLCMILKSCDVSHPAKPLHLHLLWTDRISEEFFLQGDDEKARGLPISPLCERGAVDLAKSQIGFINFVVVPQFEPMSKMLKTERWLNMVLAARAYWTKRAEEPAMPKPGVAVVVAPPSSSGRAAPVSNGAAAAAAETKGESTNDGTTPIVDDTYITVAQGTAGLRFTPDEHSNAAGSFTVESSEDGVSVAAQSDASTSTITVTPVGDTPTVADITTFEDTQSGAIVITKFVSDGAEVTHYRINAISGGLLYQNDGTTPIVDDTYITVAQGAAGLKFSPTPESNVVGTFEVQSSEDGVSVAAQSGVVATSTITVTPVGDTPTVDDITTDEDTQTELIFVARNVNDGAEVTHYRINAISGGLLYHADGTTPIVDDTYITVAQGTAGLRFTPDEHSNAAGSFTVESSEDGVSVAAQSDASTSTITVTPVGDTPTVADITTFEDTQSGAIVITKFVSDGAEVTHYRIEAISGGSLKLASDGITPVEDLDFITRAQGLAGLVFTPPGNSNVQGAFTVKASEDGSTIAAQSTVGAVSTITVTPVGDTPTVADAVTNEDVMSGPIAVAAFVGDGPEVTHFYVSLLSSGSLFLADGTTPVPNESYVPVADASGGLRFMPAEHMFGTVTFAVASSEDGATVAAQSGNAVSTIEVVSINDAPVLSDDVFVLEENSPVGTLVGTALQYNDVDHPETLFGAFVKWTILLGNDDGLWTIGDQSGQMEVAVDDVNFEAQAVHELVVEVQDGGNATATATITINLVDVNDAPTAVATFLIIPENTGATQRVSGNVTVIDEDTNPEWVQVSVNTTVIPSKNITNSTVGADAGNSTGAEVYVVPDGFFEFLFHTDDAGIGVFTALNVQNFEVVPAWEVNLTVTDGLLSSWEILTINVEDLNDPPSFTYCPNTIQMEETDLGVVLNTDPSDIFRVFDEDVDDEIDFYFLPGNVFDWFEFVDEPELSSLPKQRRAALHVVADELEAGLTNFFIEASDGSGETATCKAGFFFVSVQDRNDKPELSAVAVQSASESAPAGTRIVWLEAFDKDSQQVLTYSVGGGLGAIFSTEREGDNTRGAWLIVAARRLDWEVMTRYSVPVTVTDDGLVFETNSEQELTEVQDVTFSDSIVIEVTVLDEPDEPVVDAVVTAVSDGFVTVGGENFIIEGRNLGSALSADPNVPVTFENGTQPNIVVVYSNSASAFAAEECVVVQQHATEDTGAVRCSTAEGFGKELAVSICVSGQCSNNYPAQMRYATPSVGRFDGVAATAANTTGNELIEIVGRQFGTVAQNAVDEGGVTYGPTGIEYTATDCRVTTDHTRIQCHTTAGTGSALRWQVSVGNQSSVTPTTSYAPPEITDVTGPGATDAQTQGGQVVIIHGLYFGALDSEINFVRYGPSTRLARYEAVDCVIHQAFASVRCTTVAGYGEALRWSISISGQVSEPTSFTTQYGSPAITNATLVGASGSGGWTTEGGPVVALSGRNMGGAGVALISFAGFQVTTTVFVSHSLYQFTLPPGDGSSKAVTISVGDVSQGFRTSNTVFVTYDLPSITDIALVAGAAGEEITIRIIGNNLGVACFSQCYSQNAATECQLVHVATISGSVGATSSVTCRTHEVVGLLTVEIGNLVTQPTEFEYVELLATPNILSISPSSGPTQGSLVTLTGAGFLTSGVVVLTNVVEKREITANCPECSYTPTSITFQMPAGQGVWQVSVRIMNTPVTTPFPSTFSYLAPQIAYVSPIVGSSLGVDVVTITGSDFGVDIDALNMVTLDDQPVAPNTITIGKSLCTILTYNHTHVTCRVPAGTGQFNEIAFTQNKLCSGQCGAPFHTTTNPAFVFSYHAPDPTLMYPEHGPTTGGVVVTVVGQNFGQNEPDVVTLGVKDGLQDSVPITSFISFNDTVLVFVVGPGSGSNIGIAVTVNQQTGTLLNAFSYDPPVIQQVIPHALLGATAHCPPGSVCLNTTFAAHSSALRIRGSGFGSTRGYANAANARVFIGVGRKDIPCLPLPGNEAVWTADDELNCRVENVNVGFVSVRVAIAHQQAFRGAEHGLRSECAEGFYAIEGGLCELCPSVGAGCTGGATLPSAIQGFWAVNDNRTNMQLCSPPEACVGANECAEGYTAWMCSSCIQGQYSRSLITGQCEPCPGSPLLVLILYMCAFMLGGALLYLAYSKGPSVTAFAVAIDYFQVLSIFSSLQLNWPDSTVQVMKTASVTMANIDIASPECSLPITYIEKWYIVELTPVMLILIIAGTWVLKTGIGGVARFCCSASGRAADRALHDAWHKSVGLFLTSLNLCYVFLVAKALEGTQCEDRGDGESLLVDPTIRCDNPRYLTMRRAAFGALAVYGAGIPIVYGFILYNWRYEIIVDQGLRIRNLGLARDDNPFYETQTWFRRLYYRFRPEFWYWNLVILLQKGFIVFLPMQFRQSSVFAATSAVFVLFVAFALQQTYQPFRQNAADDKMDFSEEVAAIQNAGMDTKAKSTAINALMADRNRQARGGSAFIADFNKLQSTMLMCAIFVLLSGVLFASSDFVEEGPRRVLEVFVLIVVAGSTIVCVASIVAEFWSSVKYFIRAVKLSRQKSHRWRSRKRIAPQNVAVGTPNGTARAASGGKTPASPGPGGADAREASGTEGKETPGGTRRASWSMSGLSPAAIKETPVAISVSIRGVKGVAKMAGDVLVLNARCGYTTSSCTVHNREQPPKELLSDMIAPDIISTSPSTDSLHLVLWHWTELIGTISIAVRDINNAEERFVLEWVPVMGPSLLEATGMLLIDIGATDHKSSTWIDRTTSSVRELCCGRCCCTRDRSGSAVEGADEGAGADALDDDAKASEVRGSNPVTTSDGTAITSWNTAEAVRSKSIGCGERLSRHALPHHTGAPPGYLMSETAAVRLAAYRRFQKRGRRASRASVVSTGGAVDLSHHAALFRAGTMMRLKPDSDDSLPEAFKGFSGSRRQIQRGDTVVSSHDAGGVHFDIANAKKRISDADWEFVGSVDGSDRSSDGKLGSRGTRSKPRLSDVAAKMRRYSGTAFMFATKKTIESEKEHRRSVADSIVGSQGTAVSHSKRSVELDEALAVIAAAAGGSAPGGGRSRQGSVASQSSVRRGLMEGRDAGEGDDGRPPRPPHRPKKLERDPAADLARERLMHAQRPVRAVNGAAAVLSRAIVEDSSSDESSSTDDDEEEEQEIVLDAKQHAKNAMATILIAQIMAKASRDMASEDAGTSKRSKGLFALDEESSSDESSSSDSEADAAGDALVAKLAAQRRAERDAARARGPPVATLVDGRVSAAGGAAESKAGPFGFPMMGTDGAAAAATAARGKRLLTPLEGAKRGGQATGGGALADDAEVRAPEAVGSPVLRSHADNTGRLIRGPHAYAAASASNRPKPDGPQTRSSRTPPPGTVVGSAAIPGILDADSDSMA